MEESFFKRRRVGDQAGPGLVKRVVLEHDDVFRWPPACFHSTVPEAAGNPDRDRLLMQAHLFAGTWVEGLRAEHTNLWRANRARMRTISQPTGW